MISDLPAPLVTILTRVLFVALAFLVLRLVQMASQQILRILVGRLFRRMKRPALVESVLSVVRWPLNLAIVALFLYVCAAIFFDDNLVASALRSFGRVALVIAGVIAAYRLVTLIFADSASTVSFVRLSIQPSLIPFVRTVAQITVAIIGVLFLLQVLGFEVSSLITALGIGSLAISLAAQDTLGNLFAFLTIIGDRPFMVGDYIRTPDVEGTVVSVGVRSTRIRQIDQSYVTVPNSKLANAAVVNTTQLIKRVTDMTVGIAYTTSPEAIHRLLEDIRALLVGNPEVDQDAIMVYLQKIGQQSLEIMIRFYILTHDYQRFMSIQEELMFRIIDVFERSHISLISATNTMYIRSADAPANPFQTDTSSAPG